jgi:hypothetical protein
MPIAAAAKSPIGNLQSTICNRLSAATYALVLQARFLPRWHYSPSLNIGGDSS